MDGISEDKNLSFRCLILSRISQCVTKILIFITNQSFLGKKDPNFSDYELDDNNRKSECENEGSDFDVFNE